MRARTIPAFLESAASRWGERPFLIGPPAESYAACVAQAQRAARALHELGVGRCDRVLLMLPNGAEFLYAWWGANVLGAMAVPVNTAYQEGELGYVLRHAEPTVAVIAPEHLGVLQAAAGSGSSLRVVLLTEGTGSPGGGETSAAPPAFTLLPLSRALAGATPIVASNAREDDVAVLIYTSGTTGRPKAVMQTHRTYVLTGESFSWWLGLGEGERMWTCLPLYHINAQAYSTMGAVGGGHALALRPKFSASRFWDDIRATGATQFNAIGAMVTILMKQPAHADDAENPARLCYTALAVPADQHQAFEQRFGLKMVVGYGLSESTFGTIWPKDEPPRYGGIGRPRQHPTLGEINQLRVVDDEGRDTPADTPGEVWLRNPAVMAGYYRDEERTAQVLADGWLHTGDLARRDRDGWLYFLGRKDDMIRRKGENISAAEIEACLLEHPAIQECAVVGVPSELGEHEVKAYVVRVPGARLEATEVTAWCESRLAAFKAPRYVEFRVELPKTHTQRVAKHVLLGEERGRAPEGANRRAGERAKTDAGMQERGDAGR